MVKNLGVRGILALFVICFFSGIGFASNPTGSSQKLSPSLKAPHSHEKPNAGRVNASGKVHVVKEGDTLYEIARANKLSVRELKQINYLRNNKLRIGQRLLLTSFSDSNVLTSNEVKTAKAGAQAAENLNPPAESTSSIDESGLRPGIMIRFAETPAPQGNENTGHLTIRSQLVQAGMDFLGVPYRWKGMSERRGVDCSGLVKNLFDKFQIELPHSAREQFKLGEKVAQAELEIGDLVFFSTRGKIPTHVGIYIGDNQFLHAARRARQVIISNLGQGWYQKRFIGGRRISDLWKDDQKPPEAKGN